MQQVTIGNKLGETRLVLGEGLPTCINFIVGVNSLDPDAITIEKKKIDLAASLGVHTITDLSTVRLDQALWQYSKERYPRIGVGMNPPYLVYTKYQTKIPPRQLLKEIEWFVMGGGDHMTMNFSPRTRIELEKYAQGRKIPITSRQGGLLAVYMRKHNSNINPYYEIMDEMLMLLREYSVTVNIGSTFRPAGISEANDNAHAWETNLQIKIHGLFDEAGIPSLVEAMSHQPLHQIGMGILELRKRYGGYVPFQFLGPIVTDASGVHDHITAAIGAAEAARYNVGKVTTIPPREHTGFPSLQDAENGIIATKIAVHAGDLTRLPDLMEHDAKVLEKRATFLSCNSELGQQGCDKCSFYCPIVLARPQSKHVIQTTKTHSTRVSL